MNRFMVEFLSGYFIRGCYAQHCLRNVFVPEAQQTLAGGAGAAATTGILRDQIGVLKGRRDKRSNCGRWFVLRSCRSAMMMARFRWFRFAAPPANVRRASGAKTIVR
jgi:hypothetical protein